MKLHRLALLTSAALYGCAPRVTVRPSTPASARDHAVAIEHVRVFDGRTVIPRATVLVEDGKIAAVGPAVAVPSGAKVIEGAGDTLLPGLIDAHVHLWSAESLHELLAFGVTTALGMGTSPKLVAALRAKEQEGAPGLADFRSATWYVTVPHGHGTEYGGHVPTLKRTEGAKSFVDARIADGADYIKIIAEDGTEIGFHSPTLSSDELKAVVAEAHRRGKIAVAHVGSLAQAREVVAAGVDGLAHTFFDALPDAALIARMRARKMFVVATLAVLQAECGPSTTKALIRDPRLSPWLSPKDDQRLDKRFSVTCVGGYANAEASVRAYRDAGIPVLAGTDSPNPGTEYGVSLHHELGLLVHAGLTPTEALVAATSAPATAFHLADRGRIAPGLRADLLLVRGDPTKDITATRDIVAIWKAGHRFDRAAYGERAAELRRASEVSRAHAQSQVAVGKVSDFEGDKVASAFGSGWAATTDQMIGGQSTATLAWAKGGARGSRGALRVSGKVVSGRFPWAGAIFIAGAPPMTTVDVSNKKTLRFWIEGPVRYRVMVFTQKGGRMPSTLSFTAGSGWQEVHVPLSKLGTDGKDLTAIAFVAGPNAGPFSFELDDLALE